MPEFNTNKISLTLFSKVRKKNKIFYIPVIVQVNSD